MAFTSKIGSLLKKATTSSSSLYQSIRCMSSSKLFIGGLSYGTDEQSLREAFTNYGEVVEARVIMDRETGRSRGFGFVTFTSEEHASSAITALDGKDLHGRMVRVNYATDRNRGFGGGGGYGGGGDYGGGGGGYGGGGNYGGGGGYGAGGGSGNYGGGGGGGYGAGGGSSNYGDSYSSGGGGYGGNNSGYSGSGGGDGNYSVTGSRDSYASAGGDGGNFASSGSFGSNEAYGSNTAGGSGGYGGKQDGLLDDFKDDDDEPEGYANKRS